MQYPAVPLGSLKLIPLLLDKRWRIVFSDPIALTLSCLNDTIFNETKGYPVT